jgi:hypothetical protein
LKFLYEGCAADVEASDGELWCWWVGCNMRDSTAVYYDLFFAASNANLCNVSNVTFANCVKLCIAVEVLLALSGLRLKNAAGLS